MSPYSPADRKANYSEVSVTFHLDFDNTESTSATLHCYNNSLLQSKIH